MMIVKRRKGTVMQGGKHGVTAEKNKFRAKDLLKKKVTSDAIVDALDLEGGKKVVFHYVIKKEV